jgi:hypothetical protein
MADPDRIVEQFVVAFWNERLRQHERVFDPGKMNQDRRGRHGGLAFVWWYRPWVRSRAFTPAD